MKDFYIPYYKWEIIDFLHKRKGYKIYKLKKKPLKELYAMYFKIMKEIQENSNPADEGAR